MFPVTTLVILFLSSMKKTGKGGWLEKEATLISSQLDDYSQS